MTNDSTDYSLAKSRLVGAALAVADQYRVGRIPTDALIQALLDAQADYDRSLG